MAIVSAIEEAVVSIDFEELQGSPTEAFDENRQFTATRRFVVAWEDRLEFVRQMIGSESGTAVRIRRLPQRYPHLTAAYAMSASIEPWSEQLIDGDDDQVAEYTQAIVTVVYKIPVFEPGDTSEPEATYFDESLAGTAEVLTIPNTGLYWDSSQNEQVGEQQAPGKIISHVVWKFSSSRQGSFPAELLTYTGTVNQEAVTSRRLGFTFAAETLLAAPPMLSRQYSDTEGTRAWKIEWTFTYNPAGWNVFSKDGSSAPQAIYDGTGAAVKVYTPKSFSEIIP